MVSLQRYFIKKPISLIGFMGSGKTSVAKLLSKHTGIKYIDTDSEIIQKTRMTISEIINNKGEEEFRAIEAKILTDIIDNKKLIISTGGGCVESAISRGVLKDTFCIWLDVSPENASQRIENYKSRPMFKDFENADNMFKKRNKFYKEYSDVKINTNNKSITEVVQEVLDYLLKEKIIQY